MIIFKIRGVVKEKETGEPLPGLFIKSYDKDLFFDELLGSAITDDQGQFEIESKFVDFAKFLDKKPDVYFKVFLGDRTTLLHSPENAMKWSTGKISDHEILIPWESIHKLNPSTVKLFGDDGASREEFSPGESLTISAEGLHPASVHEFELSMDGRSIFTSRLMTNRRGELEPTVLWPQMGLVDLEGTDRYSPEEASRKWNGKSFRLVIRRGEEVLANVNFQLTSAFKAPVVISSEKDGRLMNGFEIGTQPLFLTVYNLPFSGDARIYLVPRQHDWRIGDVIEPVALADGKPAVREVVIKEGGVQQTIEFAEANALLPGAFDFVIRPVRYGFEEDDIMALSPRDIVGSRRLTGVVIRLDFWKGKPVLGGCVNKIPISGSRVNEPPYFRYRDTFTVGEDVWAGMDPGIVDPNNLSKACALYVIESKDDTEWNNDPSLTHILPGGNSATPKSFMQPNCMNRNRILIWANANIPGEYDIVADFGTGYPNLVSFVQDDNYGTPLDMIDGYFEPGFRIVEDPGTMQSFVHVGNWNYTEADMPALGLAGTVTVQDELTDYKANPALVSRLLRLKAHVFFPADMPGVVDPTQISSVQANYPLIVIIHGNGHNYTSYDFLLQHFARNGFIAASIDVRYFDGMDDVHEMAGLGRAEALFHHLTVLNTKFTVMGVNKIQNNIGVMGHSRGGEAAIKAARINQQQTLGHNINAIISLAPTDQYGVETLGGAWSKPYFVLYGSRDMDVVGATYTPGFPGYTVPQTGFYLYDRANGSKKSMCFVYRATHNGFITSNNDDPVNPNTNLHAETNLESDAHQQAVTKAYMNAFFRWHLKNEPHWDGMFKGEWTPGSVSTTGAKLYMQYRDTAVKTVDNFEGGVPNWQVSSIGGTVSDNATLPYVGPPMGNPQEDRLSAVYYDKAIDPKSPHGGKGLKVRWNNLGDVLVFTIPPMHKDVSAYSVLSFRITQKVDSPSNSLDQSQDLRVALKDGTNNERAVRVGAFCDISYPDMRNQSQYRKSAMRTVRIPLKAYTIKCAGKAKVDLQNVTTLTFQFDMKPIGEIEMDEIEFSN
jgi:hypothetical protein